MTNKHPAKHAKELYLSGLISYPELYTMVESNGWELNRAPNGILRIKGRDNNARWVVTIR